MLKLRWVKIGVALFLYKCPDVRSMKHSLDEVRELEKELEIQDQMNICSKLTQCYCTKGTPCGWCEVPEDSRYERALVGGPHGPLNSTCTKWIIRGERCRYLVCDSKMSHMNRIIRFSIIPFLAGCIWLLVVGKTVADSMDTSGRGGGKVDPATLEFLRPMRSFESFRKGVDANSSERLPTINERPYTYKLEQLKKVKKESKYRFPIVPIVFARDTAVGSALFHSTALAFVSALMIAALRAAAAYQDRDSYVFVCNILNEVYIQVHSTQKMGIMLLSFYALGRIGFWWNVQKEGFHLGGAVRDVAMLAGTRSLNTEKEWKEAYQLYRWLIVCFFLTYAKLVPKFRDVGLSDLKACGLLVASECELLEKAHKQPLTMLEAWVSDWINEHLHHEVAETAFGALRRVQVRCATMADWLDQRAPISFESLLFLTTYASCIFLPLGPMHFNLADREYIMDNFHIAPVVGVFLKSTFYLSLIRLLRKLQLPFGKYFFSEDDLYPESLILSNERRLRDYLTSPKVDLDEGGRKSLQTSTRNSHSEIDIPPFHTPTARGAPGIYF